jgi:phosphoribosylamine-glycine ligase
VFAILTCSDDVIQLYAHTYEKKKHRFKELFRSQKVDAVHIRTFIRTYPTREENNRAVSVMELTLSGMELTLSGTHAASLCTAAALVTVVALFLWF